MYITRSLKALFHGIHYSETDFLMFLHLCGTLPLPYFFSWFIFSLHGSFRSFVHKENASETGFAMIANRLGVAALFLAVLMSAYAAQPTSLDEKVTIVEN